MMGHDDFAHLNNFRHQSHVASSYGQFELSAYGTHRCNCENSAIKKSILAYMN